METPTLLINEKQFKLLSLAEKRIAICKDVIARIESQKIIPYSGQFWRGRDSILDSMKEKLSPQEYFNKNSCQVCAKGAIFCSWIGNFNKLGWGQADCVSECIEVLDEKKEPRYPKEILKVFGREFLDNLEAAFEGDAYDWHYDREETLRYAVGFEGINKLGELMHNIIMNNGKLIIPE